MNKVENLCINGVVFYIEDDAYKSLTRYLDTLKKYFSTHPDGPEVIGDIEARIAELFADKCKGANVVICLNDVQDVEATLGAPEDIANVDFDAAHSVHSSASSSSEVPPSLPPGLSRIPKKFYRDPDRRFLGGVCAGLSVFWGVPAWLIRLAWIVFPFFSFMLWPLFRIPREALFVLLFVFYFVLWIIIPKAKTPARKLAMLGMPVTVEGLRSLREQTPDYERNMYRVAAKSRSWLSSTVSKIFGAVFLLSGLSVLLGSLVVCLFQSQFMDSEWKWAYYPLSRLLPDMFHPTVFSVWEILVALSILIPVFLLISLGIKFLFGKKNFRPAVWGGLVGCWLLILVSLTLLTVSQISRYRFDESVTLDHSLALPVGRDTLEVRVKEGAKYPNSLLGAFYYEADDAYAGMPSVYVEASSSDQWEISVRSRSKGKSRLEASVRAEQILYSYNQVAQVLWLDPYFSVAPKDKWAIQRVSVTIRVPKGKFIHLDTPLQLYYGHFDGLNWEHRDRGARGMMLSTDGEGRLYNADDERKGQNANKVKDRIRS